MRRENFDKLIFNPFELSNEDLMEAARETRLKDAIGAEEGILGSRHKDLSWQCKQIRYVLYLYDKNSPLWITDPDIVNRKKRAASLAGFDILVNEAKTFDDLFFLKDPYLAKSVTAFIKYQHSNELSVLISTEQVLYELQSALREESSDFKDDKQKIEYFKTKAALLQEQDRILTLINKYMQQIWQSDTAAYEVTMDLEYNRKVTPEQIAAIPLKLPKILR